MVWEACCQEEKYFIKACSWESSSPPFPRYGHRNRCLSYRLGAVCQWVRTGGLLVPDGEIAPHQSRALQRIVFVCPCASLLRLGGLTLRSYLVLALWEWAMKRNIFLSAKHLSGTLNVSADWESRHFLDWSKWQLCPAMFRSLMQVRGPCAIDLFADRLNAQLPRFLISWRPDPMALATDALLQGWSGGTHSPLLPNNAIFSETERGDRYLDR